MLVQAKISFLYHLTCFIGHPLDVFLHFLAVRYSRFYWVVTRSPEHLFWIWGKFNLYRCFWHAKLKVPAFSAFHKNSEITENGGWSGLRETDKDNYIKAFQTPDRCVGGQIPFRNTLVDESSGSTGQAFNWVRSLKERQTSHLLVSHFVRYNTDTTRLFTINAFSMGSWATGLNMGLAMQNNGLVKNVGPDIDKVLNTLEFWGPEYRYAICGYPPFLKHLLDTARERAFPIGDFTLIGLVGGEGMSEGLRDYLLRDFDKVISGYGATDLEIGIAGETPLSIAVRRAARENEGLRSALFGKDPRLPMVFQFNPVSHYFEVNEEGELVVTIPRLNILSPRIRYNIHDKGGILTLKDTMRICREHGFDFLAKEFKDKEVPQLPFCWVFGRSDYTVSIMGANIYPEDIEQSLYANDDLSKVTSSFCLGTVEDEGKTRPEFSFEIREPITEDLRQAFKSKILTHLLRLNADFKEAWSEYPETLVPAIRLFQQGCGPFAGDSTRIKQVRMV